MYTRTFSGSEIGSWLTKFSKFVDDGRYKRIDYTIWREIKKFSEYNSVTVEVYVGKLAVARNEYCEIDADRITLSSPSSPTKYLIPHGNDFYRFFANHLFKEKFLDDSRSVKTQCTSSTPYVNDYYANYINTNTTTNTMSYDYYADKIVTNSSLKETVEDIVATISADTISNFKETVENIVKEINKENNNMTTHNMFNFDFGPVKGNYLRMSMYGYAIPNEAGTYVSYDPKTDRIVDVQILNFNCDNIFYKVPKALDKVNPGDVIYHNNVPVFVEEIDDNRITIIDPKDGTEKTILATQSPFGFDYVTTLVSILDGFCLDNCADDEEPFGKMLPLLLLGDKMDTNSLLPLMLMSGGKFDMDNPMMLLALSGDKLDTSNPLLLMAMMKCFNK